MEASAEVADFEGALEHSPSLPPEPSSWVNDWAEYSGSGRPPSGSSPPPRTSGFVRVHGSREDGAAPARLEHESLMSPPLPVVGVRGPAPMSGLGSALAPGLLLVIASALLTLVDERTLGTPSRVAAFESRPPTWVAGVLCVAGLGFLVRGLWRFVEQRET